MQGQGQSRTTAADVLAVYTAARTTAVIECTESIINDALWYAKVGWRGFMLIPTGDEIWDGADFMVEALEDDSIFAKRTTKDDSFVYRLTPKGEAVAQELQARGFAVTEITLKDCKSATTLKTFLTT